MDKTFGISVVIGGALGKGFVGSMDTAIGKMKELGSQQKSVKRLERITAASKETAKELDALRDSTKKQLAAIKATDKPTKEMRKNFDIARRKLSKLEAKQHDQRATMGKLSRSLRQQGVDTKNLTKEQDRLGRALEKTTNRMKNQKKAGEKFAALKGRALGALALGAGVGAGISSASQVQDQELYLRTVINSEDGDKDAAIKRARDHAREFAGSSLASESEVLEIEYQLNSAGLTEKVARSGTQLVHKLSTVTRGQADVVGQVFGTVFNNIGSQMEGSVQEKMQRIGNILAKTQFKYQIKDFGQLGESLKLATTAAAGARLPFEQAAAVIGQLNTAGLQGSEAGTAFSATLRQLTKARDELGIDIVRNNSGELDLIATLEQLQQALEGLDTDEKSDILQDVFGDEGKRGVLPLLSQLEQLKEGFKEVNAASNSGLLNSEYDQFLKADNAGMKMLVQNISMIGNAFAKTLLPGINSVLQPIAGFLMKGAQLMEKAPWIGKLVGGIAGGFAIYTVAIGLATAATWAWNTALLANPIGLIIAGVAAVGAGIYMLWKNWSSIWGWMKEKIQPVWKVLKWTPIGIIIQSLQNLKENWNAIWTSMGDTVKSVWNMLKAGPLGLLSKGFSAVGKLFVSQPEAAQQSAQVINAKKLINETAPNPAAKAGDIIDQSKTEINVTATEGMNEETLAKEISKQLSADKRRKQRQGNRAALYDVMPA